jgi:hypothetical protein
MIFRPVIPRRLLLAVLVPPNLSAGLETQDKEHLMSLAYSSSTENPRRKIRKKTADAGPNSIKATLIGNKHFTT